MSGPESDYRVWVRKAESDRSVIRSCLASPPTAWDMVCFHAQQGAEKLLKAFLVHHGRPYPRIHDMNALLQECAAIDPALAGLEADCRDLTDYAVVSRYPTEFYEPTEPEARELIAAAERIRASILERLPEVGAAGA